MTTVVRPPTARTRRKEIVINTKMPVEIFFDLVHPLESGCVKDFKWTDEKKTALEPTRKAKTFNEFKYTMDNPELVDNIWRLEDRETPPEPPKKKRGGNAAPAPFRRGHGCAKLHLSHAAADRGELTDLLAQVTGNVHMKLKVPHEEKSMPSFEMKLKVSTLDKNGHVNWATVFETTTKKSLRKQMRFHLQAMIDSPEYPLPSHVPPSSSPSSPSPLHASSSRTASCSRNAAIVSACSATQDSSVFIMLSC